ncbi:hypothetical protein [Promicromonospora iranensis]|uniref:Uncharacterized protein n=1 Tax=Promicromonospora iranensis TaxID=1105144 RepID=A0ABU2CWG3_9MICO|nr:hypothetical protein [Promicromonospora iranensis]MDR7385684.1 hypothetical protein [Promicromonospora iranensis]
MTNKPRAEAAPPAGETPDPVPAPEPADAPQSDAEGQDGATARTEPDARPGESEGDRSAPNAEAARYRRRLRDVEVERDQLVSERDSARAALLRDVLIRDSNLAPSALDEPDVLPAWDAVLDESGHLSPDRIRTHLAELGRSRPHLFHRPPDPIQGRTRGGDVGSRPSWSDVLSGRATRA